jgi:hypothetical protein
MVGTIDFTYDAARDLVIARPVWTIATLEDCEVWHKQWSDYLSRFGRKMDCIIVLDDFHVEQPIATLWGEYRARLTNEHHRFSCRVRSDWNVRTAVLASGALHNVAASEADSVDKAIEVIRAARRQAGLPEKPSSDGSSRSS